MRLIKPDAELWKQEYPIVSWGTNNKEQFKNFYIELMYRHIERCGRTCYKSEDKIGEKSAGEFVQRIIKSNHLAMLEHGTVYLRYVYNYNNPNRNPKEFDYDKYLENPYSRVYEELNLSTGKAYYYITTNYRVIIENSWEYDLQFLSSPIKDKHFRRTTMCFTTDRGVTHELVRHRVFSFAQESTRYCNYSKDKFGNEITFIEPSWYEGIDSFAKNEFDGFLKDVESLYMYYIGKGMTAQQARQILPNATKATIIMTGFDSDWEHVWDLRLRGTTGAPHPDMLQLMKLAYKKYQKRYK